MLSTFALRGLKMLSPPRRATLANKAYLTLTVRDATGCDALESCGGLLVAGRSPVGKQHASIASMPQCLSDPAPQCLSPSARQRHLSMHHVS